jgi:hypothetical protein
MTFSAHLVSAFGLLQGGLASDAEVPQRLMDLDFKEWARDMICEVLAGPEHARKNRKVPPCDREKRGNICR